MSYDESMGRWSESSTFELVKDPWLPAVYVGVYLLLAGAILIFIVAQKAPLNPLSIACGAYQYLAPQQCYSLARLSQICLSRLFVSKVFLDCLSQI